MRAMIRTLALAWVAAVFAGPALLRADDDRELRIEHAADPAPRAAEVDGAVPICRYPIGRPVPPDVAPPAGPLALINVNEVEPNGSLGTAQVVPLGFGMAQDVDVDVAGAVNPANDVDAFRVTFQKGDIIGATCLGAGGLDPVVAMFDSAGNQIFINNNHGGLASVYPNEAPWPTAAAGTDAALTFVAPADADFLVAVASSGSASMGNYTLRLRLRRPAIETVHATPVRQILFIDFNGATINANAIFGQGLSNATLSPLSSFLAGWGLTGADENAVIDAILARLDHVFDDLRDNALNGDFPVDMMPGHFDIEIRNSRDHADPFGQADVSRVIVGGTIAEVNISTIGIAQFIDPGNFSQDDTAIVLLDLLSAGAGNANSINSLTLDPGLSKIDAIGKVVGNVVAHEAGHFFGCWHTRNDNAIGCIMDVGGNLPNLAGVGTDNILGNGDDIDNLFLADEYNAAEGIGIGTEMTNVVVAFGLSTGGQVADNVSPTIQTINPAPAASIAALASVAVTFDEAVAGLLAARLTVNGSAATTLTGSGAGPFTFSGFAAPADGNVDVTLDGTGVADLSGNPFTTAMWSYTKVADCNNNGIADAQDIANSTSQDCNNNGTPDECETGLVRSHAGPAQSINAGQVIVLGANPAASAGTPPYTFAWLVTGGGFLPATFNEANPSVQFPNAGVFTAQLTVTDSTNCQAVSAATITVVAVDGGGGGNGGGGDGDGGGGDGGGGGGNNNDQACGASCGGGTGIITATLTVWLVATSARRRRR